MCVSVWWSTSPSGFSDCSAQHVTVTWLHGLSAPLIILSFWERSRRERLSPNVCVRLVSAPRQFFLFAVEMFHASVHYIWCKVVLSSAPGVQLALAPHISPVTRYHLCSGVFKVKEEEEVLNGAQCLARPLRELIVFVSYTDDVIQHSDLHTRLLFAFRVSAYRAHSCLCVITSRALIRRCWRCVLSL